ncbi:hypothetical protein ACJMK2_029999 [Sinanodonta woodiana]|uniref:Uncharacterized protein n=1 Tax=Sinanodonta woodiana TaxID=1069815 RepID=A0ABD3XCF8_SINWO
MLPFLFVLLVHIVSTSYGQGQSEQFNQWTYNNYPNPFVNPEACRRPDSSFICDPNEILLPRQADQVNIVLKKIFNDTDVPCYDDTGIKKSGYVVMIALMNKINRTFSSSYTDNTKAIHAEAAWFSYYLGETWHRDTCDENVVILYSKEDSVFYTSTQSLARKKLSDDTIALVSLRNGHYFRSGNRDRILRGLLKVAEAYKRVLEGGNV